MKNATSAERLLRELGVTDPRDIDLEAIAWHVGVRIRYRPLDGSEAQIIGVGDKAIAIINSQSHPCRKRFSIAHELGHWHHHRGQSALCSAADIENYVDQVKVLGRERVADGYAADLLMPEYLFQPRAIAGGSVSFKLAAALSDIFDTSLTASAMRLTDLGTGSSILVCHGSDGRKWFKRGRRVPESYFPSKEIDPRSSALRVLYGNDTRSPRKPVEANLWFAGREAARHELYEESIRVLPNEVLTLLVFKSTIMPDSV